NYLHQHGFDDIQVKALGFLEPSRTKPSAHIAQAADRAAKIAYGRSPVVLPRNQASGPDYLFFSSRRRHTRWPRDWSFRRVLFRSHMARVKPSGVGAAAVPAPPMPNRLFLSERLAAVLCSTFLVTMTNVLGMNQGVASSPLKC